MLLRKGGISFFSHFSKCGFNISTELIFHFVWSHHFILPTLAITLTWIFLPWPGTKDISGVDICLTLKSELRTVKILYFWCHNPRPSCWKECSHHAIVPKFKNFWPQCWWFAVIASRLRHGAHKVLQGGIYICRRQCSVGSERRSAQMKGTIVSSSPG